MEEWLNMVVPLATFGLGRVTAFTRLRRWETLVERLARLVPSLPDGPDRAEAEHEMRRLATAAAGELAHRGKPWYTRVVARPTRTLLMLTAVVLLSAAALGALDARTGIDSRWVGSWSWIVPFGVVGTAYAIDVAKRWRSPSS